MQDTTTYFCSGPETRARLANQVATALIIIMIIKQSPNPSFIFFQSSCLSILRWERFSLSSGERDERRSCMTTTSDHVAHFFPSSLLKFNILAGKILMHSRQRCRVVITMKNGHYWAYCTLFISKSMARIRRLLKKSRRHRVLCDFTYVSVYRGLTFSIRRCVVPKVEWQITCVQSSCTWMYVMKSERYPTCSLSLPRREYGDV